MKKPLPNLIDDDDAERFLENANLTQYDLSGLKMHSFEFEKKSKQVNMRFPAPLLDAVKATAAAKGMSYQRFIRQALEAAIHPAP